MNELTTIEQRIEEKINPDKAGALAISNRSGGLMFQNMGEVMDCAKLMAISGEAVPPHLRGKPGTCLAVVIQAVEWNMSPFAVANKSYSVNGRVAYESQLIHALIEKRAPLTGKLRHSYSGEGPTRRCKVIGFVRGENDPLVYESPEFKDIQPKNSPLWKTKPDLQLFYNASRDFCRMYFPDVLLGVYTLDEHQDAGERGFDSARDVSPASGLMERLSSGKDPAEGFAVNTIDQQVGMRGHSMEDGAADRIVKDGVVVKDRGGVTTINETVEHPDNGTTVLPPDQIADDGGAVIEEQQPSADEVMIDQMKTLQGGEPANANDPPAKPEKKKAEPKPPKTDAEYRETAAAWINEMKTVTQLEERWKAERKLRSKCGVTPETMEFLEGRKAEKAAALKAKK